MLSFIHCTHFQNDWRRNITDLISVWQRWIVAAIFLIVHTVIIFYLPVPGCPTGKFRYVFEILILLNRITEIKLLLAFSNNISHNIGYLGPGGLYDDSKCNSSCIGGATGYIDKQFFTIDHIYSNPTPKHVYLTEPFDPEGILGNPI